MSTDKQRIRTVARNAFGDNIGCSDGGCIFGHPGGMQTNGGCQCIKGDTTELRHNLLKLARVTQLVMSLKDKPKP